MGEADLDWRILRAIVLHRDGFKCRYCGDEATEADHIWPKSMGGRDQLDNLQALCQPCNRRKGSSFYVKDITEERAMWTANLYAERAMDLVRLAAKWVNVSVTTTAGENPHDAYEHAGPSLRDIALLWENLKTDLGIDHIDPLETWPHEEARDTDPEIAAAFNFVVFGEPMEDKS
jgi:hypothetical protein